MSAYPPPRLLTWDEYAQDPRSSAQMMDDGEYPPGVFYDMAKLKHAFAEFGQAIIGAVFTRATLSQDHATVVGYFLFVGPLITMLYVLTKIVAALLYA